MNPILLRSLRWVVLGLGGLVLTLVFALACTFVYVAPSLPTAENMHRVQMAVPLRVMTRTGALVSQIGEERRIPVEFDDIPLLVQQAVIAAEDDRFFQHSGLDWMGLARAMLKVAVSRSAVQGGSTISQQTARQMYLSLDKTLRRKISEVFLTWRMERDFSKEQILSLYLTKIFFGQRSYGIAAAAQTYYGKHLDELSVAQAATLAGIIQLPAVQNPIANPKRAEERRAYVLRRMREQGFIDAATAEAAAQEPVASRGFAPLIDVEAAYVAEMARQKVVELYGEAAINAGYTVYTTLDDRLQAAANRAVRVGLMDYDRRQGYRGHLGKAELPATATDDELDSLLDKYRAVGPLEPAVVLNVAATSADVHVRGRGAARIAWEGMQWAAKAQRSGVGPAPRKAADVFKRGDVIHVIHDGRGNAQLAQLPKAQAALVALDPRDGAVVSLVGGFDFYGNQFNRVTQANRQPGSSFKPFLYSAALDNGFTAATTILDAPILGDCSGEECWRPGNSGGRYQGPMRLREALVYSKNTVSVRIAQELGMTRFIEHASRFGFDPKDMPRNETLALGTLNATPLQMVRGYAVFANGGFRVEPYFIQRIVDATGAVVFEAAPRLACPECEEPLTAPADPLLAMAPAGSADPAAFASEEQSPDVVALPVDDLELTANARAELLGVTGPKPVLRGMDDVPEFMRSLVSVQGGRGYLPEEQLAPRVISPQNAWLMGDIMHDVTTRGTARRTVALGRDDLAGKTGTNGNAGDIKDNWFSGYTANIVATVWVGNDDYASLGATAEGATTAVPIWMEYIEEALRGAPSARMQRPGGLVDIPVCPHNGARAGPLDTDAMIEKFMVGHPPRGPRPDEAGCSSWESGGDALPGSGGGRSGEPLF